MSFRSNIFGQRYGAGGYPEIQANPIINTPLANDPALRIHLQFNGDTLDRSGNNFHAIDVINATFSNTGKFGGSIVFNDGWIRLPDAAIWKKTQTIMGWVKQDSDMWSLGMGDDTYGGGWGLRFNPGSPGVKTSLLHVILGPSFTQHNLIGDDVFLTDEELSQMQHFAIHIDFEMDQLRIYANGIYRGFAPIPSTKTEIRGTGRFYVGGWTHNGLMYNPNYTEWSDFAVFERIVTVDEINTQIII